jgi:hypothetical protein
MVGFTNRGMTFTGEHINIVGPCKITNQRGKRKKGGVAQACLLMENDGEFDKVW